MPLLDSITSLGLLALVLIMGYNFGTKMFSILNAHLRAVQDMDRRQTLLLQKCADDLDAIQESFSYLFSAMEEHHHKQS